MRHFSSVRTIGVAVQSIASFVAAVFLAAGVTVSAVQAREGVEVGSTSSFARLVPARDVEAGADQEYRKMLQNAASKKALAPPNYPQLLRLRAIATKLIPLSYDWNPRAREWKWEVNLIGSTQVNAFCMPGGKIAFYTGILDNLKLTDDEVAMVMGHEIAHALREHARERMGKQAATSIGANLLTSVLGLGQIGQTITGYGAQLLTLKFSREDETEADLVGMEIAARAGYNPRAGVTLWQKMSANSKGAPPQWLSTHPSGETRIHQIEANLPKVLPFYEQAAKSTQANQ
jgi:predicted Zn-dependent protease